MKKLVMRQFNPNKWVNDNPGGYDYDITVSVERDPLGRKKYEYSLLIDDYEMFYWNDYEVKSTIMRWTGYDDVQFIPVLSRSY